MTKVVKKVEIKSGFQQREKRKNHYLKDQAVTNNWNKPISTPDKWCNTFRSSFL
jgi:hypothetical protein